ncbi:MAG: DUF2807 domain-containing protein [Tannerella sp.]|jgi:phage shock protein PspC (stress-responsive transcriptional regulator)|nr:DUF2807 domain-containing protein [Tannerella sp.]
MKKTLTANLNGKVFNIDEDAFALLDNYLKNLHIFFSKEEGNEEIINDMEARIEELFSEKNGIVTISDVESVIQKMGNTSDFGDGERPENEIPKNDFKTQASDIKAEKKLYRNMDDKMIGGVCSGIAAFYGVDANLWRVISIVLFFASVSVIVPVYIVMWIFIPAARTAEEKLKMRGIPVTVENIGNMFASDSPKPENAGCLTSFISTFLMVCLVGLGLLIVVPIVFALLIALIAIVAVIFGFGTEFMQVSNSLLFNYSAISIIAFSLLFLIPGTFLIYNFLSKRNHVKPVHKGLKVIGIIIWIIALFTLLFTGLKYEWQNIQRNFQHHPKTIVGKSNYSTKIVGDGNIVSRHLEITDVVKELNIVDALHVDIESFNTNDTLPYAILKTDSNIIENLHITTYQDKLHIRSEDHNSLIPSETIVLYLPAKNLQNIALSGAARLNISEKISAEKLNIHITAASELRLENVETQYMDVNLVGASNIYFNGRANVATYDIRGASAAYCKNLESDSIQLNISGVSTLHCFPKSDMEGSISGVSKVFYKGNTATVNVSSDDVSSVIRED